MRHVMGMARAAVLAAGILVAGAPAVQAQTTAAPTTQAAQDEYVPLDELPESERLPAAPFLTGAYAFAWVALAGYVLLLWRRLGRVEQELRDARRHAGPR